MPSGGQTTAYKGFDRRDGWEEGKHRIVQARGNPTWAQWKVFRKAPKMLTESPLSPFLWPEITRIKRLERVQLFKWANIWHSDSSQLFLCFPCYREHMPGTWEDFYESCILKIASHARFPVIPMPNLYSIEYWQYPESQMSRSLLAFILPPFCSNIILSPHPL